MSTPHQAESSGPRSRRCSAMQPTHRRPLSLSLLFTALFPAAVALADARVDVEVKDASGRLASGEVTLTQGAVTASCRTVGGRCSVTVAAGRYQVRLAPTTGSPSTSQVTVPASGSIRLALVIAAPAPTTAPPVVAGKPATSTQAAAVPATRAPRLRDLSKGRRLRVQGAVYDHSGRLINATITLERAGHAIGHARCIGGRFAMYDLSTGTYDVVATSPNGVRATARVNVGTAVVRPTLRFTAP